MTTRHSLIFKKCSQLLGTEKDYQIRNNMEYNKIIGLDSIEEIAMPDCLRDRFVDWRFIELNRASTHYVVLESCRLPH